LFFFKKEQTDSTLEFALTQQQQQKKGLRIT